MQKRLLQETLAAAQRAEQAWQLAGQQLTGFQSSMERQEAAGLTVAGLAASRRWLPELRQAVEQREQEWQQAEQTADRQRETFRQARQQTRILSNLSDRQRLLHRQQELLADQQAQDELAVQAWPLGGQR